MEATSPTTTTAAEALFGECSVEVVFSGTSNRNSSSPKHNKKRGGQEASSTHRSSVSVTITSPTRISTTGGGGIGASVDPASPSPKKVDIRGSSRRGEIREASAALLVFDDDDALPRLGSSRQRSTSNNNNNNVTNNKMVCASSTSLLGSKRPRPSSTPDNGGGDNDHNSRGSSSSSAFSIGRGNYDNDKNEEVDEFDASYNITSDDDCPTPPYQPVESRLSLMTDKDIDRLSRRVEGLLGRASNGGDGGVGRRSSSQLSN